MKLLGFTEEITTCGCCGRAELKGTFAFDNGGSILYYGSECAKKAGYNGTSLRKDATNAKRAMESKMRSEIIIATQEISKEMERTNWFDDIDARLALIKKESEIKREIEKKYKF